MRLKNCKSSNWKPMS